MSRIMKPTSTSGGAPSHSPPDMHYAPGIGLARKMGWFSIALGVAELVAPQALGGMIGISNNLIVRAYGVREIGTGLAILRSPRPTGWMWGRVAGDALDVATLLTASESAQRDHKRALLATAAVCGVAAVDTLCAVQLTAAAAMEG
jgi:hypothetical protein